MKNTTARPLRLTPYAWAKLLYLRDAGATDVGGFGVSSRQDLLLIEDVCLIKQLCSEVTVKFDDEAVADYFDRQVDRGLPPQCFGRIWIHTHPGSSPLPSNTDEQTFTRCFGSADWALMFILAKGGQTYARLRFSAGPGGELALPVEVDFKRSFPAADQVAWDGEYRQSVQVEPPQIQRRLAIQSPLIERDNSTAEHDPYLRDLFWEDPAFAPLLEAFDDQLGYSF